MTKSYINICRKDKLDLLSNQGEPGRSKEVYHVHYLWSARFLFSMEGGEALGTSERRKAIMRVLCRCRNEIIENIATEFGVSERTVWRDIEALSLTEPIYTKSGLYGGGASKARG